MKEFFSLKTKIILLFLIPATVLIYFSYNYMQVKFEHLHQAKRLEFISKQTKRLTKLINEVQLERGLSAGYIVARDEQYLKKKLLQQFQQTDTIVQQCIQNSKANTAVLSQLLQKTRLKKILYLNRTLFSFLEKRATIRKKILNTQISFDREIHYYTQITSTAIDLMKFLLLSLQEKNPDSIVLFNIEKMKEYAGLERACVYNQLLSSHYDKNCIEKVFYLQKEQALHIKEFELYASEPSLSIFHQNIDKENLLQMQMLRNKFLKNELHKQDAQQWFYVATNYINSLNTISNQILQSYTQQAKENYKKAQSALYFAIALWVISILSTTYIIILLNRIFEKEEKQLHELRIAAYAFDSQEAIAITDTDEKIIRVNKGFSNITGYSQEEALGQTPRILQSSQHPKEFFEKMWQTIKEKGRWKGDIYNKRKNGEIYPERLSITAIKNDKGETTNYIAHFLDISDLKQAQQEAQYQANHDALTGIANRKLLMEILQKELSKAKRHKLTHAFMFIDLDHFKAVNDNYGHYTGDLLIQYTANVLKQSVRKEDFVARLSGDEFAVLLLNLQKENAADVAQKIADKILYQLSRTITLETNKVTISSSIGIRIFPLNDKETMERIIKDADSAMYEAKTKGKNRYILYTDSHAE
jgi:diguanylate cyclase (GGDEF)-like protein/PAS domain S-box-containing protein